MPVAKNVAVAARLAGESIACRQAVARRAAARGLAPKPIEDAARRAGSARSRLPPAVKVPRQPAVAVEAGPAGDEREDRPAEQRRRSRTSRASRSSGCARLTCPTSSEKPPVTPRRPLKSSGRRRRTDPRRPADVPRGAEDGASSERRSRRRATGTRRSSGRAEPAGSAPPPAAARLAASAAARSHGTTDGHGFQATQRPQPYHHVANAVWTATACIATAPPRIASGARSPSSRTAPEPTIAASGTTAGNR